MKLFTYKSLSFKTKKIGPEKPEHKEESKKDNHTYKIPKTGIK